MRNFEVSDRYTTADIGLDLEADSLEELFIAGAEGMFHIILGDIHGEKKASLELNFRAETTEQLMVDWLSELLFLFDTNGFVPTDFRIRMNIGNGRNSLDASVDYRTFDPGKDIAEHEIKAVTYYKMEIVEKDNRYNCHVVFDL